MVLFFLDEKVNLYAKESKYEVVGTRDETALFGPTVRASMLLLHQVTKAKIGWTSPEITRRDALPIHSPFLTTEQRPVLCASASDWLATSRTCK